MSALISRNLLKARPQELGKIKIGGVGEERQSSGGGTWRLPVKYDHFRVTTRDRGDDGNFIVDEKIHERIGAEPTELEGHLMWPEPEENFHAEMVQYDGKTKVVSCDGEERTDLKSGEIRPCPLAEGGKCKCKPYSRLHLQLWADPVGFYRVFRTTSWETTNNIQSALEDFYERFGSLYHLPVKLIIYPAEVRYEDGGKAKTSHSYMVGLVLAKSMEEVAQIMVEAQGRLTATRAEIKRLSGEVQEEQAERDQEEVDSIVQEYFPHPNVQASVKSQEKLDSLKEEMAVEGEDFEIVDDKDEEGEAGSDEGPEPEDESGDHGRQPAEPSDEIQALKHELAEAMEQHDATHLLTDKEQRRRWCHRLIGKASPRTATEFQLRQLIEAVEQGDTDPDAPIEEEPEEALRTTPFDEDDGQEGLPI